MSLPGVDLTAADAYRSRLEALLDADDPAVTRVYDDWCAYVRRHHGDVLGEGDDAETPDDAVAARPLVLDALTFDAAVDALLRAVRTTFDLHVETPGRGIDRTPAHEAVDVSLAGDTPDADTLLSTDTDDLRRLYERMVPAPTRRVFGEYYTPPGLAELGVDAVERRLDDFPTGTVLDPGCGAGAFLTATLRRKRDTSTVGAASTLDRLTTTVVGIDINPLAVVAARAAYLLTLLPLVHRSAVDRVRIPVYRGDALGLSERRPPTGIEGDAAALVGNPPWIPWERLSTRQKKRLREGPVDRLDLFDRRGATARLGHANDDLSLPFVWSCLDRYLADGGVAAFVLKRDHLRGPAGRLVRSGRVGARPLTLAHVHDFSRTTPFDGVDAAAALYVFRLGIATDPETRGETTGRDGGAHEGDTVPTTVWEPTGNRSDFRSLDRLVATHTRTETALSPVAADDPAGPWQRVDAERAALGACSYRIRHGVKDDAKAVFSVDDSLLAEIEPTHVYPYLRSKHVVKWGLFGHDRFLVPQRRAGEENEAAVERETPRTYDYLQRNRERLEARGSSWFDSGPFYSLFGLGPYTWAPYKVVWCRLGFKPHFAVVSTVDDEALGRKPVVPGDHCMFVGCDHADEAHYLCALLNATPYQQTLRDLAGEGKAGLSKSVVSSLALPEWEATDTQQRLAALSRRAHAVVPDYVDRSKRAYNQLSIPELSTLERELDGVVVDFLHERTS